MEFVNRHRICKSIAVTSGKGGVGKTIISLSLASALSFLNKKVCIIDADLGLANVHLFMGIMPKYNLFHLINEECSLPEIVTSVPLGFDIIPGASGFEQLANLDQLRLGILMRNLMELEGHYDYLIIDTGAGIGNITTKFASQADCAIIVVAPEPASFADAYAMVKILSEKKTGRLSIIVNMIGGEKEGKETFDMLNTLVVKFLGRRLDLIGMVPYDKQMPILLKRQKLFGPDTKGSLFSLHVRACARTLCGVQALTKDGLFKRLFGL